jgi:ferrous iron transport protein B
MDCCAKETSWFRRISSTLLGTKNCHASASQTTGALEKLAMVGSPNVGKSVLFNALTGAYVTVSNYPGTTVEVSRGKCHLANQDYELIDSPGMYSLTCITEEEKVTRNLLFNERPKAVLHVVDAKNLQRMLPLTLQLLEAALPVILVLNIMDEAEDLGIKIDCAGLEKELGIQVLTTAAALNRGIGQLKERVEAYVRVA